MCESLGRIGSGHKPVICSGYVWPNDDNESEGNEPQSPTYFPQTETNPKGSVAEDQEDLVDVERDNEIHNETEDKGNENIIIGKNKLIKVKSSNRTEARCEKYVEKSKG